MPGALEMGPRPHACFLTHGCRSVGGETLHPAKARGCQGLLHCSAHSSLETMFPLLPPDVATGASTDPVVLALQELL